MKASVLAGLIVVLTPLATFATCTEAQDSPAIPNGATASREEMLAAHKAVSDYNIAIDQYVECLRDRGGNFSRENRAIAKLEAVAKNFNAELRVFKQRGSEQVRR